jgi:hypothetical protein
MAGRIAKLQVIGLCIGFVWCGHSSFAADPPEAKLPPLNVSKQEISFDPKTAEVGATGQILGLMEVRVRILSRQGEKCLIEYFEVGCGGGGTLERIEIPVDVGLVSVACSKAGVPTRSFPKSARVVYSQNHFTGVRTLVPDTEEYVVFSIGSSQSEMFPQKGDKIRFRYLVFDSPKFDHHLATADFTQRLEFTAGSEEVWPWLVLAMEGMSVGDERRVQVPTKVAAGATKWLREPEKSKTIYATIRLVSIEHVNR